MDGDELSLWELAGLSEHQPLWDLTQRVSPCALRSVQGKVYSVLSLAVFVFSLHLSDRLVGSTSCRCPSPIIFLLPEVHRACDTQLGDFYSLHLREVAYNILNWSSVIDSCHLFLKHSQ